MTRPTQGQTWPREEAALADPTTTDGDMLYRTSGALARLPIGSTGQVVTVVAGEPAWQTPGGGGGGDGVSFSHIDEVGGYTHASADEFPGPGLDAAWTVDVALSGSNALKVGNDAASASAVCVRFDGSGSGDEFAAHRSYTPPGAAKSITMKCSGEAVANYHTMLFGLHQSGNDHAMTYMVTVSTNLQVVLRSYTAYSSLGGGSDIASVAMYTTNGEIMRFPMMYLHFQSDSGGNWSAWYSRDGLAWVNVPFTNSFALTPDRVIILIAGFGATTKRQFSIDWVRPDFLTL